MSDFSIDYNGFKCPEKSGFAKSLPSSSDIQKEPSDYHIPIGDWPADQRPREKLLTQGPNALSDAEVLAILLRAGSGRVTAVDLATRLLQRHGSLHGVVHRGAAELQRLKGMGAAKAVTILAAAELGRRVQRGAPLAGQQVREPRDVVRYLGPMMRELKQETVKVVLLNAQNRVMKEVTVSEGSLTGSLVHPREVFRPAVVEAAASVIVVHNHPSGNPEPSAEDIALTRRLWQTGRTMGIPLHDHVIIAGDTYTSLHAAGLLPSDDQGESKD